MRKQALNPWNFKDSADVGTLAVRYVVQPQGDKNTILRIDAVFVEDFRRVVHASNGSVESAECKDIQDRLASVELVKKETEEALRAKQERFGKEASSSSRDTGGESGNGNDTGERIVLSTPPINRTAKPSTIGQAGQRRQHPRPLRHGTRPVKRWNSTLPICAVKSKRKVKQPGAPLEVRPVPYGDYGQIAGSRCRSFGECRRPRRTGP